MNSKVSSTSAELEDTGPGLLPQWPVKPGMGTTEQRYWFEEWVLEGISGSIQAS